MIIGGAVCECPDGIKDCLYYARRGLSGHQTATVILGTLSFIVAAYFVGFYLGAFSYRIIESVWRKRRPWKATDIPGDLRDDSGQGVAGAATQLKVRLLGNSRLVIDKDKVEEFAGLCGFLVWAVSPALGAIGTRWDAEALASRSVFLGSLIMSLWTAMRLIFSHHGSGYLLAFFAVVAVASAFQYSSSRRRHIISKFEAVLALRQLEASPTRKANMLE